MGETCETCRWWKDALLTVGRQDIQVDAMGYAIETGKALGYCEPPAEKRWKGLVASDYSCGEHKEWRDDERNL